MKNQKSLFIASAVCSALTMAAANAEEAKVNYDAGMKHCYGAAHKGQNDCKGEAHSCKGQAKEDCSPKDWKMAMSKEECATMVKACTAKAK